MVGLDGRRPTSGSRGSPAGSQRRLDVGVALVGDPELLFLDEPTTGFDPSARRRAWDVIAGLRDLGKTVFLTTHYMDEAQVLADRVAIIAGGRIVAEGRPGQLGGRATPTTEIRFRLPNGVGVGELPLDGAKVEVSAGVRHRGHRRAGAGAQRAHRLGARARGRAGRARGRRAEPRGRLPRADRRRTERE